MNLKIINNIFFCEVVLFVIATVQMTLEENPKPVYNSKCKWCGKGFNKSYPHNRVMYCSDECRMNALREQKAAYQRRRRKLIRDGVLIVHDNEKAPLGTGYLSKHRHNTFSREYRAIQNEKKRLKL